MFESVHNKRIIFLILIVTAIFIVSVNIIHSLFGHKIIESLYDKSAIFPLNKIIMGQSDHPLEYYLSLVDTSVRGINLFFPLYLIGFFLIMYGTKKGINNKILLNLLWADVCFLILNFGLGGFWSLIEEWSFPEAFQYLKELFLVILFMFFFIRTKQKIFILYSIVFFYFFLDDSLRIHETVVFALRDERFEEIFFGLFANILNVFGELAFFGIVGAVFILVFFLVYRKSDLLSRKVALGILRLLFIFVFFAVVIDYRGILFFLIHSESFLDALEEMGEMVVMSILCFYALRSYINYKFIREKDSKL